MADDRMLAVPEVDGVEQITSFYRSAARVASQLQMSPEAAAAVAEPVSGIGRAVTDPEYFTTAYSRPFLRAAQAFQPLRGKRLLDACCGVGIQSMLLAGQGAQVAAVDVDRDRLEAARALQAVAVPPPGVEHLDVRISEFDVTGDWADLGSFDGIYSHAGLGGLFTADELLPRARASLHPGGRLVLKNANTKSVLLRRQRSRLPVSTVKTYEDAAARFGFVVVDLRVGTVLPRHAYAFGSVSTDGGRGGGTGRFRRTLGMHLEVVLERQT